jgi:hypothetical protein
LIVIVFLPFTVRTEPCCSVPPRSVEWVTTHSTKPYLSVVMRLKTKVVISPAVVSVA